jgi:Uncharacterized protein conserved in bacteria (DUF2188)
VLNNGAVEPHRRRKESTMTQLDYRPGSGGVKDNVRDELEEAARHGRSGRSPRKEAAPEEVGQPGSGGVKDNVRDELAESQESLETQGWALRRKGELKTYAVLPRVNGGWKVQAEWAGRASSVHRTKPEAVAAGKELAKHQAPSQLLVYKKDGLEVQEEQTYG